MSWCRSVPVKKNPERSLFFNEFANWEMNPDDYYLYRRFDNMKVEWSDLCDLNDEVMKVGGKLRYGPMLGNDGVEFELFGRSQERISVGLYAPRGGNLEVIGNVSLGKILDQFYYEFSRAIKMKSF